jgi:hypothetical protein
MSDSFAVPEDMAIWAECIGGLMINFGACEYMVLQWLEKFEGKQKALKIIKRKGSTLEGNIRVILHHIPSCSLSDDDKRKAAKAWGRIYALKDMRNRLAHNPIAIIKDSKGNRALRVIDMKKITASKWMRFDVLHQGEVFAAFYELSEIKKSLTQLLASLP